MLQRQRKFKMEIRVRCHSQLGLLQNVFIYFVKRVFRQHLLKVYSNFIVEHMLMVGKLKIYL